jgi:hypothetical protein
MRMVALAVGAGGFMTPVSFGSLFLAAWVPLASSAVS